MSPAVNFQEISHLHFNRPSVPKLFAASGQRFVQDLDSRGVNVNATLRKVGNAERAVPFDDPQRTLLIQHRK